MKYVCLWAFLLVSALSHSQTDAEIDDLTKEMCKTLVAEKGTDSARVDNTMVKHFPAFLREHKIDSEEKFREFYDKVFFRMQKNCQSFVAIMSREFPQKGDWKKLAEKPAHALKKKECREISSIKNFYYLEHDGSKTRVTIDNGYWNEVFDDGTFSKLRFRWTGDCEFEIEFVESNNRTRKNFSTKGDTYRYGIFGSDAKGYDVWVEDTASKTYMGFRLYPEKK